MQLCSDNEQIEHQSHDQAVLRGYSDAMYVGFTTLLIAACYTDVLCLAIVVCISKARVLVLTASDSSDYRFLAGTKRCRSDLAGVISLAAGSIARIASSAHDASCTYW